MSVSRDVFRHHAFGQECSWHSVDSGWRCSQAFCIAQVTPQTKNYPTHTVSSVEVRTSVLLDLETNAKQRVCHTFQPWYLRAPGLPPTCHGDIALCRPRNSDMQPHSSTEQQACSELRLRFWDCAGGKLNSEEWWQKRRTFFKDTAKEWLLLLWPQEYLLSSCSSWSLLIHAQMLMTSMVMHLNRDWFLVMFFSHKIIQA